MKKQKNLNKKQQALQDEWDNIQKNHSQVTKFAGKYSTPMTTKHKFKIPSLSPAGGSRQVNNSNLTIRSLPMGNGGTIPYDASLEEAKAGLAHRVGQLYNKAGPQYMSDEDMKDVKAGLTRRR